MEEAKKISGKVAEGMSDERFQEQLSKMEYLIESLLNQYDRSIFGVKALNELN